MWANVAEIHVLNTCITRVSTNNKMIPTAVVPTYTMNMTKTAFI